MPLASRTDNVYIKNKLTPIHEMLMRTLETTLFTINGEKKEKKPIGMTYLHLRSK